MPHSSPDRNISKPIYECLQCYVTILRVLAHDCDTSTNVNVTVLNPYQYYYLLGSNVPNPPAHSGKSFKAPSHSCSGGDPDDPSGADGDDESDDDDEDEEDAAFFGPLSP
jgi:hypothetical protein